MKRITHLGIAIALLASPLCAQTTAPADSSASASSLGDYARKVHKDTGVKAKPKVFDNDNLPKDDKLSIVGEPAAVTTADNSTSDSTAKTTDSKDTDSKEKDSEAAKPGAPGEDEQAKRQADYKSWQDKLSGQKNAIDLASRELEVTQKEYQLRAADMYADAGNRLRNQSTWDKQDADFKQQIADKQKALDDAKQKLDDMEEQARKAGVPASMREQ
jgi:hypothetical protein